MFINKIEGIDWRQFNDSSNLRRKRRNYKEKISYFKGRKRIPIEELKNLPASDDNVLLFMSQVEAPKGHTKEWLELSKKISIPVLPFVIIREHSRFTKENFSNCKINIDYCDRDSRDSDEFGYYLRSLSELPEYCNIISEAAKNIDLIVPSLNGIVKEVTLYLDTRPNGQVEVSVKDINYFNCIRKDTFSYDIKNDVVARIEKGTNNFFVSCNPYGETNPYFPEDSKWDKKGLQTFGISEESLDHWNSYLNELMRSIENQIKEVIVNMEQKIKNDVTHDWNEYCIKERQKQAGGRTAGEWEDEFSMWDK
jgi:hypothetical protein|nr:MAG TPA: hypothetical protein [Caudoviricetes sp.]